MGFLEGNLTVELILHLLEDALMDTLKMLPFLFGAYLLMEYLEHHSSGQMERLLAASNKSGPVTGALLGCVPQCGFSVAAANLYCGRVITPGTLLAVFFSTSDEAVPLLLASPGGVPVLLRLMAWKVALGAALGLGVDAFLRSRGRLPGARDPQAMEELCEDCHCEERGVLRSALHHTAEIFVFLFLTTLVLGGVLELIGEDRLSLVLMEGSILQPALAGIIGLIPNCGASVLLTQLLLDGTLSFGAALAGLSTNAGVGLLVLLRVGRRHQGRNLQLMGVLYSAAVVCGMVLQAAGV